MEEILTDEFLQGLSKKISLLAVTVVDFSSYLGFSEADAANAMASANLIMAPSSAFRTILSKFAMRNGRKSESALGLRKRFLKKGMEDCANFIKAELEKFNIPVPSDEETLLDTPVSLPSPPRGTPEPHIDVAPDVDGLYTDWKIQKAEPRKEQFDPEENYVLHTSNSKGLVLILNNDHFPEAEGEAKRRPGSEQDLDNIQHVFTQIGYKPVIKTNLSAKEIHSFLDESVTRINLKGSICHSSVVLVLMSHGGKRGIYGTDLDAVTIQEIKSKFSGRRCPALLGKPKIFFIQACRGQMPTKSALDTDDPRRLVGDIDSCSSRRPTDDAVDIDGDVPDNADMYVAYATSEGYFSIRNRVKGSWFIQSLCEELIAHVHIDDLDTMMNRVTRRVTSFTGSIADGKGKRQKVLQTPVISKQGIGKKIYFMPHYPPRSDSACSST